MSRPVDSPSNLEWLVQRDGEVYWKTDTYIKGEQRYELTRPHLLISIVAHTIELMQSRNHRCEGAPVDSRGKRQMI